MNWVDVKKQLPKEDGSYLIHAPSAVREKPLIHIAWYNPKRGCWSLLPEVWTNAITHWMPLPKPPTKETKEFKTIPKAPMEFAGSK